MTIVLTEFDGKVFVPEQPVQLPKGTKVAVTIPSMSQSSRAPSFSAQDDRDWERILGRLRSGEPEPPTLDEAMREIRMRP